VGEAHKELNKEKKSRVEWRANEEEMNKGVLEFVEIMKL
jgi:hypothetical protein